MEQLKCLVDIAQTGSLTSTAQRLYMTQPAVSQRIKQLEQDLGVDLLIRTKAGTQLTTAGEKIVKYAEQILKIEQEMKMTKIFLQLTGAKPLLYSSVPTLSIST